VRAVANKAIEEKRAAGLVGSSLQSELDIYAEGAVFEALSRLGNDLRFVLITSRAKAHHGAALEVQVTPSPHIKCDRCWHYRADVGSDAEHPHICGRCVSNLFGDGEVHSHA
jgi:isoleucyl-tRNA synthetase